jgi:hypothetical protein
MVFKMDQKVKISPAKREALSGKVGTITGILGDNPKATRYGVALVGVDKVQWFWGHELKEVE